MSGLFGNLFKDLVGGGSQQQSATNQSTSTSQSTQSQIGGNAATSFGNTGSTSASSSVGGSNQSIAFGDLFKALYGGASAAAAGIDASGIAGAASQLFSGGLNFLQNLTGNPGTEALAARATNDTAQNAQLEALKSSLGDFYNEQLLPGITSQGVVNGTLGGSRDAVAQSLAAKQVANQFAQGAASIIGTNQAQKDAAATALASNTTQNAATGLSSLSSLFGLAQGGANASLDPYSALAAILGGPTTLTSSNQVSNALASSFGAQGSQSYGFDFGTGNASSSSQSTGSSQGSGDTTNGLLPALGSIFGGLGKLAKG